MNENNPVDKLLTSLQERAKELNCLYRIEETLSTPDASIADVAPEIVKAIPPGWQYPDICEAKLIIDNIEYKSAEFDETDWAQHCDITVQDIIVGSIHVYYLEEMPQQDEGPFLKEEAKLIKTIADRIGHFIMHQRMRRIVTDMETARAGLSDGDQNEWKVVLQLLRQTDQNLYLNISRKMLNHLCWTGIKEAEKLLHSISPAERDRNGVLTDYWNQPMERQKFGITMDISKKTFEIADNSLSDEEILRLVQRWIQEDKLSFLVKIINRNKPLSEVTDAIRRYYHLIQDEPEITSPNERGIQVSLIRRFLSDQLQYINVIKHYIEIKDFYYLLQKVLYGPESHGRLGGKSAGLYLASQILKKKARDNELFKGIKIPRTWHITSDVLPHFMHYNNFEEVVEQKYKEINQVRLEYPHIVETFKRAIFPPDIAHGLSVALDDFGEHPLIVRSSSLLEDRVGAAFSGKYKSLFLANQGTKQERLEALMDAIAEVYASTFSPDPIEYRAERGLLDFGEEMGIIIQEVVGKKVGKYFIPAFAGVAFSNNEFRWSPRISRKDGLVRLVPGLGTRAVDRLSNDYPVLMAPGQPGLRVNVDPEEVYKYSPKMIDVINLETNSFESLELDDFLKTVGDEYPAVRNILSVYKEGHITQASILDTDYDKDQFVVTFDGLIKKTPFVKQMHAILMTLEDILGYPVDIEFASDGDDFHLLQCRAQSYSRETLPAPIPKDVPEEKIVFSAGKYISNGQISNITHIVYISTEGYSNIGSRAEMQTVGRVVGKLNKLLPKRQFILIGPGRWGSRGDIKLGVNVTYSDINNTAMLIEVARKKGNYVPDLSFGTHFFQDLVEANIRYLPLYPDDDTDNVYNTKFLRGAKNILPEVLPEYANLADTIHLIDIPKNTDGQVMQILMNAELEEAVAILSDPTTDIEQISYLTEDRRRPRREHFWRWRYQMVETIAESIDSEKFGVAGLYVFGSTKNATAGPGSDIDIIVHFNGSKDQEEKLKIWLDGWSKCLAELNYMRTGYRSEGLLDVHIVTDEDIEKKTSYAAKIGAVTDPARPLKIGHRKKTSN